MAAPAARRGSGLDLSRTRLDFNIFQSANHVIFESDVAAYVRGDNPLANHRCETEFIERRHFEGRGVGYGVRDRCSDEPDPGDPSKFIHLAELVPFLRQRLGLDHSLTDYELLESLKAIAMPSARQDRWRVAFGSVIGRALSERGTDLNTALNIILTALPSPRL